MFYLKLKSSVNERITAFSSQVCTKHFSCKYFLGVFPINWNSRTAIVGRQWSNKLNAFWFLLLLSVQTLNQDSKFNSIQLSSNASEEADNRIRKPSVSIAGRTTSDRYFRCITNCTIRTRNDLTDHKSKWKLCSWVLTFFFDINWSRPLLWGSLVLSRFQNSSAKCKLGRLVLESSDSVEGNS